MQPRESSTPEPENLNPLTDVLYLEKGKVKKIIPRHEKTNVKRLLVALTASMQMLGDEIYGVKEKHQVKRSPDWANYLLSDIAKELNISTQTLFAIMSEMHNKDYAIVYLNTYGFRTWSAKEGLDQLETFLEEGIGEIKAYYERKGATESFPGEDGPPRSHGSG